jgi:hypothetical protein
MDAAWCLASICDTLGLDSRTVPYPSGKGPRRAPDPSLSEPQFSFAYSALASFRMGISGSASFQCVRKAL